MGLDITAYSNLELVEELASSDEYEEKYSWDDDTRTTCIYRDRDYPEWGAPLKLPDGDGVIVYRINGEQMGFHAGSYSGYNRWREMLSEMAHGVSPRTIWESFDKWDDKPFVRLINFSDCEGVIGSDIAKVLAKDFADFQERADQHPDDWFRVKYADWRRAFELAAQSGAVRFH